MKRLALLLALLAAATALAAAPPDSTGELAAAQALLQAGQPARAQAVLDRVLARQPDLVRARYLRGQALQQQQRWDEALNDYVQVLAVAPDDPALHLNIGYIYLAQQQPAQARQELLAVLAIRRRPSPPWRTGTCSRSTRKPIRRWRSTICGPHWRRDRPTGRNSARH